MTLPLVKNRGVSLQFLVDFAWEHDSWEKPTADVVRDIIIPATEQTKLPYVATFPLEDFSGPPLIFVSHAWGNPFGLLVAAVRKFISNDRFFKGKSGSHCFIWVDIFAITQHSGPTQMLELTQVEDTIAGVNNTLLVLDINGLTLNRCWCIFEVYCTFYHSQNRYGKLQVRVGTVSSAGNLEAHSNQELLMELAGGVDVNSASATVASDKEMIMARLNDFGLGSRDGVHELNRKLQRAVRHGWI